MIAACLDVLTAAIALPFAAPVWFLPLSAATALGRAYGRLLFLLYPIGRRTALINLRRAYGQAMTRPAAARLALDSCAAMGEAVAEGIQWMRRGTAPWDARLDIEDERLARQILDDPRPKVFVTGHLGAWELAGALAAVRGGGGAIVVRSFDNRILDALFRRLRARTGFTFIEKRGGAGAAYDHLRAGRNVGFLGDENGGRRGTFVPFFGRPASTHRTPALLAIETRSPVVVGAAIRRGSRLLYRLNVIEPSDPVGPSAVSATTAAIAATFERWIRDDPAQWRWIHWRWKTRPDRGEETYTRADVARAFAGGRLGLRWLRRS